ncbi:MAG: 16S rRNA (cytosine(1402)-N(4))-methyltransferase RsmH [Candidatus Eremiobacteraeota bacterium]|nr:16S rRNA (cytosine(1402)-N(4))-methyltransferase RsmH [Candidatus Eremiobacteraeota bacterium]
MLQESLDIVVPPQAPDDGVYVDATFGGGGHTEGILSRKPASRVVALDADPQAVERARNVAKRYAGRLVAVHANFADLDAVLDGCGIDRVDGVIYDLGLSSWQLAASGRGFSFAGDEPLDMRFDPTSGPTAADMLAHKSEDELAHLIARFGERHARRIARRIADRRRLGPLASTGELVAAIRGALPSQSPRRRSRIHFATRTFMALRVAVNDEERALESTLGAAVSRVRRGGGIAVISFHSGEDRIVKHAFGRYQLAGRVRILTRKPLRPGPHESAANSRSRSARLRGAVVAGA